MDLDELIKAASGPLGQLMDFTKLDQYSVLDPDKLEKYGEANAEENWWALNQEPDDLTGDITEIRKGRANVYNGDPHVSVHELMHLLKDQGVDVPLYDSDEGYSEHPWIAAQLLYNAADEKELADVWPIIPDKVTDYRDLIDDMAGDEFDMGARLQFDPRRGHGVEEMVDSSLDLLEDPRDKYIRNRNKQSYLWKFKNENPMVAMK